METAKERLRWGTFAVLVATNAVLALSAVQGLRASGRSDECIGPDNPGGDLMCYCFGDVCVGDFPGFYYCEMGWHDGVLDPIWVYDIGNDPIYTQTTCREPN